MKHSFALPKKTLTVRDSDSLKKKMQRLDGSSKLLEDWPAFAAELICTGSRGQRGRIVSSEGSVTCGIWEAEANTTSWLDYPVHEWMLLLEGEVAIITPTSTLSFRPGDCFVIPRGLRCVWSQPGRVRKFFVASDQGSVLRAPHPSAFRIDTSSPHLGLVFATSAGLQMGIRSIQPGDLLAPNRCEIIHDLQSGQTYLHNSVDGPFSGPSAITVAYCSYDKAPPNAKL